jgi:hypothetical protein
LLQRGIFEIGKALSVFGKPDLQMRRAGARGFGLMAG